MATFSWQIVDVDATVTSGTGTVRDVVTVDDMASHLRRRHPNAVEVAVWEGGKPTDRPAQVRDPRQVA